MARKSDIQYIQLYTDGSAARQLAPKRPKKKKPVMRKPSPKQRKQTIIRIDPLAVCSICIAVVMLVLLAVGMVRWIDAERRQAEMAQYISELEEQNQRLWEDYSAGYDLAEVKNAALALGMVPAEQIQQVPIQVTVPQTVEEPTFWQRVSAFFAELFA